MELGFLKDQVAFVSDFFLCQLSDELNSRNITRDAHQVKDQLIADYVSLQQPQKIQVSEFRQQVFPVELIVVDIMFQRATGFAKFIHSEKIIALFFDHRDFNLVINPEIQPESLIEVKAKLIILNGRDDAQQPGICKKLAVHVFLVEPESHTPLINENWFRRSEFYFRLRGLISPLVIYNGFIAFLEIGERLHVFVQVGDFKITQAQDHIAGL